jgi:putative salt-induced outer membrane protein YdiY
MLHYTTAGIQLNSMVNFSLISLPRHKFRIGGGTVLRYQSSSLPDVYGIYFNNDPDDPTYRFNFYNQQNIFTIGYSFDISYIAKVSNKFQLGIKAQFQNDTNGDAITQLSLIVGRYLTCSK